MCYMLYDKQKKTQHTCLSMDSDWYTIMILLLSDSKASVTDNDDNVFHVSW